MPLGQVKVALTQSSFTLLTNNLKDVTADLTAKIFRTIFLNHFREARDKNMVRSR